MKGGKSVTVDVLRTMAREGVHTIRQQSAVYSLLWLCGIVSVPSFAAAAATEGAFRWAMFGVSLGPILLFGFAYVYFMHKDPSRLHSEEW
jgi:hypothetical protein